MGPAAVILTTLLVWLLAPELPAPARAWTAFLLVPLPVLMVWQARQLHALEELPRRAAYASTIIALWVLAAITAVVARFSGITPADIGIFGARPLHVVAWTAGLTVGGIATLFAFRALGFREGAIMHQLLPTSPSERAAFVAVSITAGICEEFIFRGFLLHALAGATDSVFLAVLLSSGAFGVLHAYQRPLGALRAGLLGALLAVPILLGQPILAAILAHALIDIIAGLWLARWLLR